MSSESERDTSRVVVQTYLPSYQRDVWDEHAEELGMSRSEFVRAMVQAGRRGFGAEESVQQQASEPTDAPAQSAGAASLEDQIVEQIGEHGALSWEDLLTEFTDDIEGRLERSLESLQESGRVRHSGPAGGYVLEDDP